MFKKSKEISIENNTIRRIAKKYNNVFEKLPKFSYCFDSKCENYIDWIKQLKKHDLYVYIDLLIINIYFDKL